MAYGSDEDVVRATIPDALHEGLQIRQGGLSEALLLASADTPGPDLRQGDFAPRLPFARWWRLWQRVVIALAVALVLKTGASAFDYVNMKGEDVRLRQAIQQSYRRVNPKQKIDLGTLGTQAAMANLDRQAIGSWA